MRISQENAKKEAIAQQKIHEHMVKNFNSDSQSNNIPDAKTQVMQRNSIVGKRIPSTITNSMQSQKVLTSKGKVSIIDETSPSERATLPALTHLPSFSFPA